MNSLKESETAWLAGIYEGEGSCAITNGRSIHVEITMTDLDVMQRIVSLTGLGKLAVSNRGEYKTAYRWGIGSKDAVEFLSSILPWLGERRTYRATSAIDNWTNNKKQSIATDTHCIHGHSYEAPNKRTAGGSCRMCANEASRRYKARKKQLAISPRGESQPQVLDLRTLRT